MDLKTEQSQIGRLDKNCAKSMWYLHHLPQAGAYTDWGGVAEVLAEVTKFAEVVAKVKQKRKIGNKLKKLNKFNTF